MRNLLHSILFLVVAMAVVGGCARKIEDQIPTKILPAPTDKEREIGGGKKAKSL